MLKVRTLKHLIEWKTFISEGLVSSPKIQLATPLWRARVSDYLSSSSSIYRFTASTTPWIGIRRSRSPNPNYRLTKMRSESLLKAPFETTSHMPLHCSRYFLFPFNLLYSLLPSFDCISQCPLADSFFFFFFFFFFLPILCVCGNAVSVL